MKLLNFLNFSFKGKTREEKLDEISNEICKTLFTTVLDNQKLSNEEIGGIFLQLKEEMILQLNKNDVRLKEHLIEFTETITEEREKIKTTLEKIS